MKKIIFSILGIACLSGLFFAFGPEGTNKNYNLPYDNNLNTLRIGWLNNGSQSDSLLVHANNGKWVRRIAPISTILSNYPTNSSLTSQLSNYTTNTALTNALLSYVTNGVLTSQLANYATTASVNTGLSGKANNSNTVTINGVSATLGSNPNFTLKTPVNYSGITNASGNFTVTFPVAYAVPPNVQASIPNQSSTNQFIRVSAVSTTGFTINVYQRNAVTLLGIEVLLAATTNVTGANVDVIVQAK